MNENEKLRIDFLKVESRKPGETFNKVYFTCHKNDAHYYDEMAFDVFKYSTHFRLVCFFFNILILPYLDFKKN